MLRKDIIYPMRFLSASDRLIAYAINFYLDITESSDNYGLYIIDNYGLQRFMD